MVDKTWTRRFAWWRRGENYEDDDGFIRMEVHPEMINHMGFKVNRNTFIPEAQDVAARMYAMSSTLPNLTAKQLRDLCENPEDLERRNKRIVFEYEEGLDSDGDPAWLITVGIATTDEEE
jgi:hypothetical protein